MQVRLDMGKIAPDSYKALMALENFVQSSGLDKHYIHLIKLRASQINGCAFCVDMHVKEARRHGLSEQWINLLSVWRESPLYDAKERALLNWVESVTNIAQTGIPDDGFETLSGQFSPDEIAKLTVAIGTINVWKRIAVGFRFLHPIDAVKAA